MEIEENVVDLRYPPDDGPINGRELLRVLQAMCDGDFSVRLPGDWTGLSGKIADTFNDIVAANARLFDELDRVGQAVGKQGKTRHRVSTERRRGAWGAMETSVNTLIGDLLWPTTAVTRTIAAVAKGDLSQTMGLEVDGRPLEGEFLQSAKIVNKMIDQMSVFTSEVTRVAREVGADGKLGGQAQVKDVSGVWKDLTDNVNSMANNLTNQVRGIVKVVTAVANGDLAQKLTMESKGEVAALADTINNMTDTLAIFADQVTTVAREVGVEGRLGGQANVPGAAGTWKDLTANVNLLAANLTTQVRAIADVATAVTKGDLTRYIQVDAKGEVADLKNYINAMINAMIGNLRETTERNTEQDWLKLQQTNKELAQKAQLLAAQNAEVEHKNREIDQARRAVEEKATELALTSRYKSEFLANMSHELRTPLNSILILGQQLSENADANLSPRQVEFAKTIHAAGTDLLNLISDILDLSKIESGTVTVECEDVPFPTLKETVERSFRHEAEARKLAFTTEFDPKLGGALYTDPKRLLQVLKNLLSNAFRFTEHGGVRLRVSLAHGGWTPGHPILDQAPSVVELSVSDTGIGIPPEKQKIIFEAFQQADAGTARKYGGTGLGLAISRELAQLLGGEIRLSSVPGSGSTFMLYLPLAYVGSVNRRAPEQLVVKGGAGPYQPILVPAVATEEVPDDRKSLEPGDQVLLIVEDDAHYARVLLGLAREHGFKGLVAMRGADALTLARKHLPTAISLDVFLPDMLGWTVLSQLKQDPATRHIPVQILTVEEEQQHGLSRGAFSYLNKPATTEHLDIAFDRIKEFAKPRKRRLLVIEDSAAEQLSIAELIGHEDIEIVGAKTGGDGLTLLRESVFDCVVLDLRLPDMSGFDLLDEVQREPRLRFIPIVVFTGRDLSADEEASLRRMAKSIVLKGAQSPERLFDETSLFLHRVIGNLPEPKQRMLQTLYESDESLAGKKVLVVDDDVRNIFALSSVLERHDMQVISANNGRNAIELIEQTSDLSLVLMDIMMPEMDGYETMRQIRQKQEFRLLPIVALTAKAMKGDREKCLEAGASDYIAKPVDNRQLLSLLRMWLYR